MELLKALRYSHPSSIAFAGAGGKTTAIFKVARELLSSTDIEPVVKTVFVTTSTHFGAWQAKYADRIFTINSISNIIELGAHLPEGVVLLVGQEENHLLNGLPVNIIEGIWRIAQNFNLPLLIEADGSHMRPLKAPAEHEPAIPQFVQCVVHVAGLEGLGKPLSETWVHRPEKFAELSGLAIGVKVTDKSLIKVLLDNRGGLKNIPPGARRNVLLTQADTPALQSAANRISTQLLHEYHSVIIAGLAGGEGRSTVSEDQLNRPDLEIYAVNEQIAGIIMAAGGSSRFGEPKQLLEWKGKPLIRHVAVTSLEAGLSPVIVVVGSSSGEVESAITDLHLRIVINREWKMGMSTSIRMGVTALPQNTGGVVFMQADQPQVPSELIKSLVEAHAKTLNPIVVPEIDGQRGNPVLFDAATFQHLKSLSGDIGGRALFSRFPVQWIPWHDKNILLDIDTPEDYHKFLHIYPEVEEKE